MPINDFYHQTKSTPDVTFTPSTGTTWYFPDNMTPDRVREIIREELKNYTATVELDSDDIRREVAYILKREVNDPTSDVLKKIKSEIKAAMSHLSRLIAKV